MTKEKIDTNTVYESEVSEILGQPKKYESSYGEIFYFNVEMANGHKASIGKKNLDAIKVGSKIKYKLVEHNGFLKIQEINPKSNGNGKTFSKKNNAEIALGYAVQLATANISRADAPIKLEKALADKVTALADHFKAYLEVNQ